MRDPCGRSPSAIKKRMAAQMTYWLSECAGGLAAAPSPRVDHAAVPGKSRSSGEERDDITSNELTATRQMTDVHSPWSRVSQAASPVSQARGQEESGKDKKTKSRTETATAASGQTADKKAARRAASPKEAPRFSQS